jgi:hypothetical protein
VEEYKTLGGGERGASTPRRRRSRRPPGAARVGSRALRRGRAVQVDPIKPMLKAPEIKRLKLIRDEPL